MDLIPLVEEPRGEPGAKQAKGSKTNNKRP